MAETVERVKNRFMGRANDLTTARIVIDRHAYVGAGSFTGNEIAVGEVNEQAALPIGWIIKGCCAIGCLARVADHCTRVGGRCWSWFGCRLRGWS